MEALSARWTIEAWMVMLRRMLMEMGMGQKMGQRQGDKARRPVLGLEQENLPRRGPAPR